MNEVQTNKSIITCICPFLLKWSSFLQTPSLLSCKLDLNFGYKFLSLEDCQGWNRVVLLFFHTFVILAKSLYIQVFFHLQEEKILSIIMVK